jgi:WD40 repeat protein
MTNLILSILRGLTLRKAAPAAQFIAFCVVASCFCCALRSVDADSTSPDDFGGNLVTPRSDHTANLLADGRVLLAGGFDGTDETTSAETYDPATNHWSATGSLKQKRRLHASSLLPDGRVLVAGGQATSANNLNSAEIYDPATGRWTLTGNMLAARALFDMVLLPNGKVLAVGGLPGGVETPTAELYDPATGAWTATGDLNTGNGGASHLTLLNDGKVLIAGGFVTECELYDPDTGTWTLTGSTFTPRFENIQTLLADGRVLVAGGIRGSQVLDWSEIYNPATGLWRKGGPLNTARRGCPGSLLANGRVFAAGGSDPNTQFLTSIEEFDPVSRQWRLSGTSLAAPRSDHTATTLLNGDIIIAGGGTPDGLSPNAELFVRPR